MGIAVWVAEEICWRWWRPRWRYRALTGAFVRGIDRFEEAGVKPDSAGWQAVERQRRRRSDAELFGREAADAIISGPPNA